MAELGHTDALVFTAGVGENDDYLRERFCTGLEELGIKLDKEKNAAALARKGVDEAVISTPDSRVKVFMVATNEELVIVEDTLAIMNGTYNPNHLKMDYSFAGGQQKIKNAPMARFFIPLLVFVILSISGNRPRPYSSVR